MGFKQAIVLRTDLNMSSGKLCAQAAHASLEAALKAMQVDTIFKTGLVDNWRKEGAKKVVLMVSGKDALVALRDKATQSGIQNALIKDAGLTEIPSGTITSLGIGPDREEKIDKITGHLETL